MNFKQAVQQYILEQQLLSPTDKVLVTLSGGADSVALLLALLDLNYSCTAVHCNFHLRGEESMRDERFVRNLCKEKQITLYCKDFSTAEYAESHHLSIEMAARELRYAYFETLRKEIGAHAIAVAHHMDDSVETVLLNLIRGTGIDGLQGIRSRNGAIIRPLLGVSKNDILNYLQKKGQSFVTDSTNLEDEYTRNKIRLNLLPLMREINPSVNQSIQQTAERLKGVALFYHQDIDSWIARIVRHESDLMEIDLQGLLSSPSPSNLLFEILRPYGFNATQLGDMLSSCTTGNGKSFISENYRIIQDRKALKLTRREKEVPRNFQIPQEGIYPLSAQSNIHLSVFKREKSFTIDKRKTVAVLDADLVSFPLNIRSVRSGDLFYPFGMKGRKKLLSDFMTDLKYSTIEKEQQVLLCNEKDEILWVVGKRTDERFRITEETQRIMKVELHES